MFEFFVATETRSRKVEDGIYYEARVRQGSFELEVFIEDEDGDPCEELLTVKGYTPNRTESEKRLSQIAEGLHPILIELVKGRQD